MKFKSKLWLLPLSTALVTPLAVVACSKDGVKTPESPTPGSTPGSGDSTQNSKGINVDVFTNPNDVRNIDIVKSEYVTQRVLRNGINSTFQAREFDNDVSNTYGSWNGASKDQTAGLLIRKSTVGKAEIERKADASGAVTFSVKRPSMWKYKLELASKVVLTTKDGQKVEFDKDDALLTEKPTNGSYKLAVYQGFSEDDRSINSKKFFDTLKDSTKLQIEVKKGVKWVNSNGEQTKYEVVPQDFYISWMRTQFLGAAVRKEAGKNLSGVTTEELDKAASSILSSGSTYFGEESRYPNEYLYGLYRTDSTKFSQEDQLIQDNMVTFHKLETEETGDFAALLENLTTSQDFVAAPSQYIAEKTGENLPELTSFNTSVKTDDLKAKLKQIPAEHILSKSGVYWYGINDKNNLYAGAFYYKGYDKDTQEESWVQNKYFVDQDWVNSPTSIKQYVLRYKNQGDEPQFKATLWDDYKKGRISSLPYTFITDDQRTTVEKSPLKYGLEYSQSLNKSQISSTQGFDLLPAVTNLPANFNPENAEEVKNIKDTISYNDTFSNLVYGKSVDEMIKSQFKGDDVYNLLSGNAVIFRSLISAAINFDHVASFVSEGKSKMYIAGFAPDANIGGSDQISSNVKSLRDDYDNVNSIAYLNADYTKSDYTSPDDYAFKAETAGSNLDKLKSPQFEKVKAEVKKFLDANNVGANDKVTWQLTYRYINWNPQKMEAIYAELPNLIKELDPRLDLKTKIYSQAEVGQFYNQHLYGRSPQKIGGWGYDVNSLGSGIDGFASLYDFAIPSLLLGQDLPSDASDAAKDNQTKFKTAFPALFKLSQEFNNWIKEQLAKNAFTLSVGLEQLRKLTLAELDEISHRLSAFKYDETQNKLVANDSPKPTDVDLTTLTSRFFTSYTTTLTNAQNIDLAKELILYTGVTPGRSKLISREGFSPTLTNPYYVYPFVGGEQTWYSDTKVFQEGKN
ncbi:hypothetical protein EG856_02285 [Mycoplasmopsis phocirhinis]|uniref:Lipoprotein n=1 Tax=Mycoplasmopsis phocirhinis TaxID=142650 RepID=A0A4P6MSR6_9BACT|nr:hypothetical protein [Mycoplasmopsis phocirhinis]QBF34734.1 hypothetical protein EG856_02285 [Mycoplasmopsis phocirhinis]